MNLESGDWPVALATGSDSLSLAVDGEEAAGQSVTIASVTGPVVMGNDNVVSYTTQARTVVSDGYEQILDQTRTSIEDKAELFVETTVFKNAVTYLTNKKILIIVGPPGCGKTVLASALLRRFFVQGFEPLVLHSQKEWRLHVGGSHQKQIVLMDNIFGRVSLNKNICEKWRQSFITMSKFAKECKCLVVITLYGHILHELKDVTEFKKHVLTACSIIDLESELAMTDLEKKDVISFYIESRNDPLNNELVENILESCSSDLFLFWCLDMFTDTLHKSCKAALVFSAPALAMVNFFTEALRQEPNACIIAGMLLLAMNANFRNSHYFSPQDKLQDKLQAIGLENCNADQVNIFSQIYIGTFLTQSNSFRNRMIYDAAAIALNRSRYGRYLLSVCDKEFMMKYMDLYSTLMEVYYPEMGDIIPEDAVLDKFLIEAVDSVENHGRAV